ncbi:MAG TPA: hypothetical protein EYP06_02485 [Desulfobacterales bacterium]|nr:hypothetical protein [Desulfobacterales bacterium]
MKKHLPIILAHGVYPFHRLFPIIFHRDGHADDHRHYFKGIRTHLTAKGYSVFHSRVSWGGSLDKRADDLKRELERITGHFTLWPKVHIIAHSMGGLDARWMMFRHDMAHRISSLTTIGTPHYGSSHANGAITRWSRPLAFLNSLGIDLTGVYAIATDKAKELNSILEPYEREAKVVFRTIAGVQTRQDLFFPMRRYHDLLLKLEGENDGLVSLASAMWKEEYLWKRIDADHLNQIGWWGGPKAMGTRDKALFRKRILDLYLEIAQTLPE